MENTTTIVQANIPDYPATGFPFQFTKQVISEIRQVQKDLQWNYHGLDSGIFAVSRLPDEGIDVSNPRRTDSLILDLNSTIRT